MSVLGSVLAHHTVGVSGVVAESSPVHVQALDIVSVDGQPVGPDNFAARDLVTEIAALDGGVRPDEIGTPWPIQSPGFFSDASSQGCLHLAFESPGVNSAAAAPAGGAGAVYAPAAASAAPGAAAPAALPAAGAGQAVPAPGTPGGAVGAAPGVSGQAQQLAAQGSPAAAQMPAQTPVAAAAPAPGAAAPAVAPAGGTNANPYVDMLPKDAQIGRVDMGVDVDLKPGEPIVAPGTSRVLGVMPNWYAGQPYVALQLLDGPMKGHNYYVAEQINLAVSPGQIVQQGQPIAHYASSGTGIEMGWAGSNWEQTLAQAQGNTGDASHNDAPAGISFKHFLDSLTQPASSAPSTPASPADAAAAAAPGAATPAAPAGAPGAVTPGAPPAAGSVSPGAPAVAAAPGSPAPAVGNAVTPAVAGSQPPAPGAPVGQPAPLPGEAQFQAASQPPGGGRRHTVQFLPAIQPGTGAPPAAAAAEQPALAQTPAPTGQPVVEQVPGAPAAQPLAPGAAAPQPGAPGAVDPLGQVAAAAPAPGSVISVSSSLLTSGQQTFAAHLASLTGLDPRVVAAWELAEESGSAAQGRQAASNFNWLNIGYFDSGAGQIAFVKQFGDPVSAAEQTARFLKGTWGGASTGIRGILSTVGKPPEEQIMAIANSGWASSHYGGGANLRATFDELSDIKIQTAPPSSGQVS